MSVTHLVAVKKAWVRPREPDKYTVFIQLVQVIVKSLTPRSVCSLISSVPHTIPTRLEKKTTRKIKALSS